MPLAIQELTRLRAPIFHWQEESYELSRLEGETILRHLGCGHGGKTVKEETPTGSSECHDDTGTRRCPPEAESWPAKELPASVAGHIRRARLGGFGNCYGSLMSMFLIFFLFLSHRRCNLPLISDYMWGTGEADDFPLIQRLPRHRMPQWDLKKRTGYDPEILDSELVTVTGWDLCGLHSSVVSVKKNEMAIWRLRGRNMEETVLINIHLPLAFPALHQACTSHLALHSGMATRIRAGSRTCEVRRVLFQAGPRHSSPVPPSFLHQPAEPSKR